MFQLKRLAAAGGTAALLVVASSGPAVAQVFAVPDAAVKFDVKPKQAQVYVDGFYAGIVDDYNDWYERLYTAPGGHEITLFLEGYRTHTQRAYLAPDHTFKVKFQMEKLPAGETAERPPPPPPPPRPTSKPVHGRAARMAGPDSRLRKTHRTVRRHRHLRLNGRAARSNSVCSRPTPKSWWTGNRGRVRAPIG